MLTKKCGIWHLIAGIIMLILGFVVWANPLSSLYAIAIYVGAILFILGCGYITFSFSESSAWYFVIGLMDVFIGLIFLTNLGLTVETLPTIFALWILALSCMQLYGSLEVYKLDLPWGWSLFSGILYYVFVDKSLRWMFPLTIAESAISIDVVHSVCYNLSQNV